MRLLMLDNEFPPLGGGMGTANEAVLRRFAERPDLSVDLITAALGSRAEVVQFAERIRLFKVPVWNRNIHHSTNRELLLYTAQALPLALRLHRRQRYDRCFAWSALPAGGVALTLRRLVGLPYMIWVSGPDIPGFEQRYARLYPLLVPMLRPIWRQAQPLVAKCADEITMIHAVDPTVPVLMIPNGVDLAAFQPGPPLPDDGPLEIVCVARLIERKGQHHLIEAVQRLTAEGIAVRLSLVGTGDSLADYQALAARLHVVDRVRFAGYVPRERIAAEYQAAHVFALPSFCEGMSVAALEAMGAGLPVVLSRTGGTAELLDEGVQGLSFDWADVTTLTDHLRRLATDRALARQMGAAARERALRFSWDTIAARYLEVLTQPPRPTRPRREPRTRGERPVEEH